MRKNKSKEGRLKKLHEYIENAKSFFANEYKFDVKDTCDIKLFSLHPFDRCNGLYSPLDSKITIYGVDVISRNQVIHTLFHELIHFWQHKIVKTIKLSYEDKNLELCQPNTSWSSSSIKDIYHSYEMSLKPAVLYYKDIDTNNIKYWNKPHEIEARQLSLELFYKWNSTSKPLI